MYILILQPTDQPEPVFLMEEPGEHWKPLLQLQLPRHHKHGDFWASLIGLGFHFGWIIELRQLVMAIYLEATAGVKSPAHYSALQQNADFRQWLANTGSAEHFVKAGDWLFAEFKRLTLTH